MAEKADVWMPLYIGDYLRDTRFLTLDEHGAYLLLLMEYWVSGPLPDEDRRLARLVGCSEHSWSMLRASLEQFFDVRDGVWRHKRADKERTRAGNLKESRKSKAKAAAEARWGRREDAPGDASGNASSDAPSIAPCNPPSQSQSHIDDDGGDAPAKPLDLVAFTQDVARAAGIRHMEPRPIIAHQTIVREWLAMGATDDEIIATVAVELENATERISSLRYFDRALRQTVARRENRSNGTASPGRSPGRRPSRSDEIDDASRALGLS